jgi:hypothetical protein
MQDTDRFRSPRLWVVAMCLLPACSALKTGHEGTSGSQADSASKHAPAPGARLLRAVSHHAGDFAGIASRVVKTFSLSSGTTYYVGPNGRDSDGAGLTPDDPFLTLRHAASVMSSGDTVQILAGTYRETVTPPSGTTFMPYGGQAVTVSGADLLSGWSLSSGSIYSAPMAQDLGRGNNQVFVDGQVVLEARYPATDPASILTPNTAQSQGTIVTNTSSPFTINDSGLPGGDWSGSTVLLIGRWCTFPYAVETGLVTSSDSGTFTAQFDYPYDRSPNDGWNGPTSEYILVGSMNAMTYAGSWIRDGSGNLDLWTPSSDDPSGHTVEVKARATAFDLSGRSNVTIQGLAIFAANIIMDSSSSGNVIDGVAESYPEHFTVLDNAPTGDPGDSHVNGGGIVVSGSGNTVRNSQIAFAAGTGINLVTGSNQTITNNRIHDIGYAHGGIGINTGLQVEDGGGNTTDNWITYNTIYNTSGMGIEFTAQLRGHILHNEIHHAMIFDTDGGSIYGSGTHDAGGIEIAYNLVHDMPSTSCEVNRAGIYMDNEEGGVIAHHNVIWNTGIGFTGNGGYPQAAPNQLYNNTVATVRGVSFYVYGSDPSLYQVANNILFQGYADPNAMTLVTNLDTVQDLTQVFADPADNDYSLAPGSPAIDQGTELPPWTDGFVPPAPDIGAYEYGLPKWTAGANVSAQSTTIPSSQISVVSATTDAANAPLILDGDVNTQWTVIGFPQSVVLNLGGSYSVTGISIQTPWTQPSSFQVYLSSDGAQWADPVYSGGDLNASFQAASGSYLMLTLLDGNGGYCFVGELQVRALSGS